MASKWKNEHAVYRELSVPFETVEACNKALNEFLKELADLRKKHKVADLYVIMGGLHLDAEGNEAQFILNHQWGDAQKGEAMTAYAFGKEQTERQHRIKDVLRQATRQAIARPSPEEE